MKSQHLTDYEHEHILALAGVKLRNFETIGDDAVGVITVEQLATIMEAAYERCLNRNRTNSTGPK